MTFNRGFPETSGSLSSLPIRENFEHLLDTAKTHVSGSNAHNADAIDIDVIGSPLIDNIELMDDHILSASTFCADRIVDDGDGTITVTSGSGFIRTSDLDNAPLVSFDWASSSSIAISDDLLTYVYIDYNGGNPIITITADRNDINDNSQICIGHVYKESGILTIYTRTGGLNICDFPRKVDRRIKDLRNFERSSGMVTSETGTRNIIITAGEGWRGLDKFTTLAKNTSVDDTFIYWYRDGGGGWTKVSGSTQIDNVNYDDGSGTLQSVGVGRYGVHWVFLCEDPLSHIDIVYGQGNYKLAEAQNAEVPSGLPDKIDKFDLIIAKIIILRNAATFTEVATAFEIFFPRSEVINHNDLGNIDGGKVDEYYHLEDVEHGALVDGGSADEYHTHPKSGSADTLDSVCERGATTDQPITVTASGSVFTSLLVPEDLHVGNDLEVDDNAVVDGVIFAGGEIRTNEDLVLNYEYGVSDANIYFRAPGPREEYLRWDKDLFYFYFSDALYVAGALTVTGNTIVNGNITASSSGSLVKSLRVQNDLHVGNDLEVDDNVVVDGHITVLSSGSLVKSLRVQNDLHIGNDLEVDDNVVVDGTINVLSSGSEVKALKIDDNLHIYGDLIVEGSGGGGSITATIILPVQSAKISGNFIDTPALIDGGSGAWKLLFSATQSGSAVWQFRMPQDYTSALTAKLIYTMATATADKVDMEVEIMALSDGESDPDVASFDAVNEVAGGTTVPDTAGKIDEISIVCSNDDSVVANDLVTIRVSRDYGSPNDTATGDLELRALSLEYTTS